MIVAPRFSNPVIPASCPLTLQKLPSVEALSWCKDSAFQSFVSVVDVSDHSRPSPENMVFVIERTETVAVNFDTADVIDLQNELNFT
ncbi:hypothetical protein LL999_30040 [Burkholderia ambifaria]|uniref:hypothetical protein n=1 Tax=Burkholderia ambifaria TaxID=152480 RepID=UPI001E5D9194|nr:hypothetical protein [Burkholderia ambifaria]UEP26118.1 hypothetical protein LL999_30040 [Burkholderia ambifaria]